MLDNDFAARLVPVFQRYARYYARLYNVEAEELEAGMYLALVEQQEDKELLSQKPAYIAKRMAGWSYGRMRARARRERNQETLEALEWVAAPAPETDPEQDNTLVRQIAEMAARHDVDVSKPVDILEDEKMTPRLWMFHKALESLEEDDERIAVHLIAGRSVRELERRAIAPRRAAYAMRRELVETLRN